MIPSRKQWLLQNTLEYCTAHGSFQVLVYGARLLCLKAMDQTRNRRSPKSWWVLGSVSVNRTGVRKKLKSVI